MKTGMVSVRRYEMTGLGRGTRCGVAIFDEDGKRQGVLELQIEDLKGMAEGDPGPFEGVWIDTSKDRDVR